MVRLATDADAARITVMAERFVAETPYRSLIATDPQRVVATVRGMLGHEDSAIYVSEDRDGVVTGMIALTVYDHPFSGVRTAFEVVWWVNPESRGDGLRLLRAAESWARERGARQMQMVAPDVRVGHLYERLGYAPVEVSYQRSL